MLKRRSLVIVFIFIAAAFLISACSHNTAAEEKIPVKVLILPKFEVGEMSGDFPGEAQYFYEEYLAGGYEYDLINGAEDQKIYVKDGIALCLMGQGSHRCDTE